MVLETGAAHSRVLQSDANLKKNVKSLADMQHGAASSSSAGAPEATKSEGFAASEQKLKDLGTSRTKLSKNLEDLLLIAEIKLKGAEDSSCVKKGEEVEAAKTSLEVFLGTVRLQLAKKLPTDRTDACEDFLASLSTLLEQSAVHEVGSKSIIKSTKPLLA